MPPRMDGSWPAPRPTSSDIAEPDVPLLGAMPEYLGKSVLAELEIPVPPGELAMTLSEARKIAGRIGYPVVIKADRRCSATRAMWAAAIVGIDGQHALSAAWERLKQNVEAARPKLELDGVLIETMAAPGIEMMVGGRRDPPGARSLWSASAASGSRRWATCG